MYTTFLESLQDLLGVKSHDLPDNQSEQSTTVSKEITLFSKQFDRQMKLKGVYNPLLQINFENIFTSCMAKLSGDLEKESYEDR